MRLLSCLTPVLQEAEQHLTHPGVIYHQVNLLVKQLFQRAGDTVPQPTLLGLSRFLTAHGRLVPLRAPLGRPNPPPRVQLLRILSAEERLAARAVPPQTPTNPPCVRDGAVPQQRGRGARPGRTALKQRFVTPGHLVTASLCGFCCLRVLVQTPTERLSDAAAQVPPTHGAARTAEGRGWGVCVGTETAPEAAHLRGV